MREFKPHAVLLDIAMPDSGRYKKGSDRVLAELAGFDYHVGKPYDVNALLSLLRPLSD